MEPGVEVLIDLRLLNPSRYCVKGVVRCEKTTHHLMKGKEEYVQYDGV